MSRVFLVEFKDDRKRTRWVSSRSRGTQSSGDETGKAGFGCAWAGQGEVPQSMGLFLITGRLVWSLPHPSLLRLKPSGVTTLPK